MWGLKVPLSGFSSGWRRFAAAFSIENTINVFQNTFLFLTFSFICLLNDLQHWQTAYQSSVRQKLHWLLAIALWGTYSLLHTPLPPPQPSPPPQCPCRPHTRVTYNWFINNANRCLGSSLARRQPRRASDYCVRSLASDTEWKRWMCFGSREAERDDATISPVKSFQLSAGTPARSMNTARTWFCEVRRRPRRRTRLFPSETSLRLLWVTHEPFGDVSIWELFHVCTVTSSC